MSLPSHNNPEGPDVPARDCSMVHFRHKATGEVVHIAPHAPWPQFIFGTAWEQIA